MIHFDSYETSPCTESPDWKIFENDTDLELDDTLMQKNDTPLLEETENIH